MWPTQNRAVVSPFVEVRKQRTIANGRLIPLLTKPLPAIKVWEENKTATTMSSTRLWSPPLPAEGRTRKAGVHHRSLILTAPTRFKYARIARRNSVIHLTYFSLLSQVTGNECEKGLFLSLFSLAPLRKSGLRSGATFGWRRSHMLHLVPPPPAPIFSINHDYLFASHHLSVQQKASCWLCVGGD